MSSIIVLDSSDEEEEPRKRPFLSRSIPATITPLKTVPSTGSASKLPPKTRTIPSSITVTRHSPVTIGNNSAGAGSNSDNSPLITKALLSQTAAKPQLPALTKINTVFPCSLHVAAQPKQLLPLPPAAKQQKTALQQQLPQLPQLQPSPHFRKRKTPTPPLYRQQQQQQLNLQQQKQLQQQQQQKQQQNPNQKQQQVQQQQQKQLQPQLKQQQTQFQQQQNQKQPQPQQQQQQQKLLQQLLQRQQQPKPIQQKQTQKPQQQKQKNLQQELKQQLQEQLQQHQKHQDLQKELQQQTQQQLQKHQQEIEKQLQLQQQQQQAQKQQELQKQLQLTQQLAQKKIQQRKRIATPPSTVTSASTLMPMIASVQSMAAGATPPLQLMATPPHVATSLYYDQKRISPQAVSNAMPQLPATITPQILHSPSNSNNNNNNNNNNYNNNNNNFKIHLPPKRNATIRAASPRGTPSPVTVLHTPPPPPSPALAMPVLSATLSTVAEKSVRRIKPTTLLRPNDDAWQQRPRTNVTLLGDDDIVMELLPSPSTSAATPPKAAVNAPKTESIPSPVSALQKIVGDVSDEKPIVAFGGLTVTKVNGTTCARTRLHEGSSARGDSFTSTSSAIDSPNTSITTIADDDEAANELPTTSTKAMSKPPSASESRAPLEPYYEELLAACRLADGSPDMERLIKSKLVKYYHEVHPEFVKSRGFRKNVQHTMTLIRDDPKLVYYHLQTIVEELKARRKGRAEDKPIEESASSATSTGNKRTDEQIKKLNNALYIVTKHIEKLEAADVDWDNDEVDSAYLQMERYKKRACQIYEKICDLTGESKNAHRQVKKPIQFNDTAYPQFNKTLRAFINRTKEFPDFNDVLRMLEHCNTQYEYGISAFEMKRLAHDAFVKVGKLLQSRRKTDLYETVTHFTANAKDPAATDPALSAKLSENLKNQRKISDIIEQFALEQDMSNDDLRRTRKMEKDKARDAEQPPPSVSGCSADDINPSIDDDHGGDDNVDECADKVLKVEDNDQALPTNHDSSMAESLTNGLNPTDRVSVPEATATTTTTTTTATPTNLNENDSAASEMKLTPTITIINSETVVDDTRTPSQVATAAKILPACVSNVDSTSAISGNQTNPKPCDKTQTAMSGQRVAIVGDNDEKRNVNKINCNSSNSNNNNKINNNNNLNIIMRAKTDNSVQAIDTNKTIITKIGRTTIAAAAKTDNSVQAIDANKTIVAKIAGTTVAAAAPPTQAIIPARRNDCKPMAIVNGRLQPITVVSRTTKTLTKSTPTMVATTTTGSGLKIVSVSSLHDTWHKLSDNGNIISDGSAIAGGVAYSDKVVIVDAAANSAKQKLPTEELTKTKEPCTVAEIVISDEES